MTLRIGWLSPFYNRSGVGTFSKAVTDVMPARYRNRDIDLTVVTRITDDLYDTRHRVIDIDSIKPNSKFYELFDILVFNIGNNEEHHKFVYDVLRIHPGIVICHDHVYQHVLAKMVNDGGSGFADYAALAARYGSIDALRRVRQSNITQSHGLRYALWDSEHSADMPLGAPLYQLGSALVVHSRYAEDYAATRFEGPILRLGMPHDQRPPSTAWVGSRGVGQRRMVVSFGHVQSTKCIHDVLAALAASPRMRDEIVYVIAGFASDGNYLGRLRNLVSEHRLEECVRFSLNLKDAELDALSAEADAFINLRFPNTEGASVSLIEQLLTAKPVVVFDTGCYAEIPDDAVIKVARSRDKASIIAALHRLLDSREALDQIGARGRTHALKSDCRGYASDFLDFVTRKEGLLRRRAGFRAEELIEASGRTVAADSEDAPWNDTLATARETLNLLEQGRLAEDPGLIEALNPEMAAEYAQAAILRSGTNLRLNLALRDYFADGREPLRRVRILRAVHAAVTTRDGTALTMLPQIVPHGDMTFWAVVAALGDDAITLIAHGACFGTLSADPDAAPPAVDATALRRLHLAAEIERRAQHEKVSAFADVAALVAWMRKTVPLDNAITLNPLPAGQMIDTGAQQQGHFLEMIGFYEVQSDHAWTKPYMALLYVSPAHDATRIILYGNTLHGVDSIRVDLTAENWRGPLETTKTVSGNQLTFEIILPDDCHSSAASLLCLKISSVGCRSPEDMGYSADSRPLGLQVQKLSVV